MGYTKKLLRIKFRWEFSFLIYKYTSYAHIASLFYSKKNCSLCNTMHTIHHGYLHFSFIHFTLWYLILFKFESLLSKYFVSVNSLASLLIRDGQNLILAINWESLSSSINNNYTINEMVNIKYVIFGNFQIFANVPLIDVWKH